MKIYRNTNGFNGVVYDTEINEGSKRVLSLMSEDYILLRFSCYKYGNGAGVQTADYNARIGDFVVWRGEPFYLTERYVPRYNSSTGGYDHEIRFEAQHMIWKNRKLRYSPTLPEAAWSMTQTPAAFLDVLLANISHFGFIYRYDFDETKRTFKEKAYTYRIKDIEGVDDSLQIRNIPKAITFSNVSLIDGLSRIADEWKTEWVIRGGEIILGKAEQGEEVVFSTDNVSDITPSGNGSLSATRLYPFGSTRNVPPRYDKDLTFVVSQSEGHIFYDAARMLSYTFFPESERTRIAGKAVVSYPDDRTFTFRTDTVQTDVPVGNDPDEWPCRNTFTATLITTSFADNYNVKPRVTFDLSGITMTVGGITYPSAEERGYNARTRLIAELYIMTQDNRKRKLLSKTEEVYINGKSTASLTFPSTTVVLDEHYVRIGLELICQKQVILPDHEGWHAYGEGDIAISFGQARWSFQPEQYKVTTRVVMDGQTMSCVINPKMAADGTKDSNEVQISGMAQVGTTFTFPTIIPSNVPVGYFTRRGVGAAYGSVERRLRLPQQATPIERDGYICTSDYIQKKGVSDMEVVEDIITFEEVYPKTELRIESVESYYGPEDEEKNRPLYFVIQVTQNDTAHTPFDFKNDYWVDGERRGLHFNSGKLAGMEFDVNFYQSGVEGIQEGRQVFEILASESYGPLLPNESMRPEKDDVLYLFGWDADKMDATGVVAASEQELLAKVIEYARKSEVDPNNYTCPMLSSVVYENGLENGEWVYDRAIYDIGRKVLLRDHLFEGGERSSRIIGYEINLDIPYDTPTYTVGEAVSYSRLDRIESNVQAITYTGTLFPQQAGGSGTGSKEVLQKIQKEVEDRQESDTRLEGLIAQEAEDRGKAVEEESTRAKAEEKRIEGKLDDMFTDVHPEGTTPHIVANHDLIGNGYVVGKNGVAAYGIIDPSDPSNATSLRGLLDVSISGESEGQVLTWDDSRKRWVNRDPAKGLVFTKQGTGNGVGNITYDSSTGAMVVTLATFLTASSIATGQSNGTISVNGTDVKVKGLGSSAYTNIDAFVLSENLTKQNIKGILEISDWALAGTKPDYTFSEIGGKPTTIAGYGITDAKVAHVDNMSYVAIGNDEVDIEPVPIDEIEAIFTL